MVIALMEQIHWLAMKVFPEDPQCVSNSLGSFLERELLLVEHLQQSQANETIK